MKPETTVFAISTYRLRAWPKPARRNGHAMKIMVFDDSSVANHEKYFPLLENKRRETSR